MAKITLYGPAGAPFVIKVRGALALKGLPYEMREPRGPEDFRRWSPETGLLPVIEVDGQRIPDSSAILDHLDRAFPEPPLVAADPKAASAQRRLEAWAEATFTFYWTAYLRALVNPAEEGAAEGARSGIVRVRRRRRGSAREDGLGAEFRQRLDDLVNFLGGRPFYYGDRVGRADLAVYSFLARLPDATDAGVGAEIDARPALRALLARVEEATPGLASVVPPRGAQPPADARVGEPERAPDQSSKAPLRSST